MPELTIADVQHEFYELYRLHAYGDILTLLDNNAGLFSGRGVFTFYNWKMCAAALNGNTPLALAILRDALDNGAYWGEKYLRSDEDLATLQGNPEFEQLVTVSNARQLELQQNARPDLIVVTPTGNVSAPYPWLMALHGNGSNPRVTAFDDPWQAAATRGWLLAMPQSGQIVAPDSYVWDDRDWLIREVQQHITGMEANLNADPARGVIGGFSMGGGQALWLALTGTIQVSGLIAVAPWLPANDIALLEQPIAEGKANHLQIVITVSRHDEDCYHASQAVSTLLTKYSVAHRLEITDQEGHFFPADFESLLTATLEPLK